MNLNEIMEFDHVVLVNPDGTVTDAENLWAPEVYGGMNFETEVLGGPHEWTLLQGFTGQYGYNGPVMHPSEFIGGGLERHILSNPGYYAAVAVTDLDDYEPYGWAVAFLPAETL